MSPDLHVLLPRSEGSIATLQMDPNLMEFFSEGLQMLSSLFDLCGESGSSIHYVNVIGCDVCFCGNNDVDHIEVFQILHSKQSTID